MGQRNAQSRYDDDARTHYQGLIELLSDAVVLLDQEERQVIAANSAAEHLLGYDRVALNTMRLDDLLDPTEVPRLNGAMTALTTTSAAHGVWRVRHKDGPTVPVDVVATRCVIDGQALVQVLARDLSDAARLETVRSMAATASSRLAASLEYEAAVRTAVELAVPGLADTCTLDVVDDAGRWCRAATATYDPTTGDLPTVDVIPADAVRAELAVGRADPADPQTLALELHAHGRMVGMLSLCRDRGRVWSQDAQLVAGDLARRVALALDSALLWRTAQRELSRRAALLRIVRAFAEGAPGRDRVMEVLLNEALAMLGGNHGGIALWDAPTGTLVQVHSNTGRSNGLAVSLEESLSGRAAIDRRPVISNSYQQEYGRATPGGRFGAEAGAAAPMLHERRLLGIISIGTTDPARAFKQDDAEALELLAGVASSMLGRSNGPSFTLSRWPRASLATA